MMSAEDFHRAKEVLEAGRTAYNLYLIEDARAALAPIKKGYARLTIVFVVFALSIGFAARIGVRIVFGDEPAWLSITAIPAAMLLAFALMHAPAIRERILPVHGVKLSDIQKASQLW